MAQINIQFNGDKKVVSSTTLAELLSEFALVGKKLAIEHNRVIVPKANYEQTSLADGDSIEVVHFVGGG